MSDRPIDRGTHVDRHEQDGFMAQEIELWSKRIVVHLEKAITCVAEDDLPKAATHIGDSNHALDVLGAIRHYETNYGR